MSEPHTKPPPEEDEPHIKREPQDDVAVSPTHIKIKFEDGPAADLHLSDPQVPEQHQPRSTIDDNIDNLIREVTQPTHSTMVRPFKLEPTVEQKLADSSQVKEAAVGIREFVTEDIAGLFGIFKQRYSDFLVNEIDLDGSVVHLETLADSGRVATFAKGAADVESQKDTLSKKRTAESAEELDAVPPKKLAKGSGAQPSSRPSAKVTSTRMEAGLGASIRGGGNDSDQIVPADQDVSSHQQIAVDQGAATSMDQEMSILDDVLPAVGVAAWQSLNEIGKETYVKEHSIPPDVAKALLSIIKQETIDKLNALNNNIDPHGRIPVGLPQEVRITDVTDKETRTQLHRSIRTIFDGRLRSSFDDGDGAVVVSASSNGSGGRQPRWNSRKDTEQDMSHKRGAKARAENNRKRDYLHFTLLKINRDTMETVSFLARCLKMNSKEFTFAGTKDRRSVSTQRVSARRLRPEKLLTLERAVKNGHVGDWEYKDEPLKLGNSKGNEFVVTMRDVQCHTARHAILAGLLVKKKVDQFEVFDMAVSLLAKQILEHGFINYFGLQRFGTYNAKTNEVGLHILRGEFKEAVDLILDFSEEAVLAYAAESFGKDKGIGKDDACRAMAISLFRNGKVEEALKTMSRNTVAEYNIIRHLGQPNRAADFLGALMAVSRNNRLMYVHAYQSLIWNLAASHRRKKWGEKVVEGDLVLVKEHAEKEARIAHPSEVPAETVDADGEIIIQPADDDRMLTRAEADSRHERARALTAEEAESGKYDIFDIVLPLPGFDILYPSHMVQFYEETMGSKEYGELNPHDMRRKWNDISLPGSYRKLMARVEDGILETDVKVYRDNNKQFVETDIEKLTKAKGKSQGREKQHSNAEKVKADDAGQEAAVDGTEDGGTDRIAVILKFRLGSSTYATMMLREFFKGGVIDFKTEYSNGH